MLALCFLGFLIFLVILIYKVFSEGLYKLFEYLSFLKSKFRSRKLKVGVNSFSYAERGKGNTLLFIHGFQSNKHFWLEYASNTLLASWRFPK